MFPDLECKEAVAITATAFQISIKSFLLFQFAPFLISDTKVRYYNEFL